MVDIRYLKKRGVCAEDYKKIWSRESADYTPRQKKLVELLRNRVIDGRTMNLREWRAYHAIDLAHEVSFNQTTPTLIHHILSKRLNATETLKELEGWGLNENELFLSIDGGDGRKQKMLNVPVFFQIFIPIVKAYVTIRLAKIFNERKTVPLLPFQPLKETTRNQILCDIWTDIINTISTWYGYPAVLRQSIQQMLKYGICLAFPREEWHYEEQMADGEPPKPVTVKEGLRYIHPHPTQMFWDMMYPLTSINSDTGVEYAGHWTVMRFGDLLDNRMYWNRRKIFAGTNWFESPLVGSYFKEVFPCQLNFLPVSWGMHSRDDRAAWYNVTSDRDKAVFVTEHFMKLIPDDWGLTDTTEKGKGYKYPVWHRFTIAGDDTIIWASPCAYNPVWFMGYDYDENAAQNPSLGLELIPWQDHLGNLLSQMLLTAKQNLASVNFYNNQAIDKADIDKLQNQGERFYRGQNWIGFNPLKFAAARIDIEKVFHSWQFNHANIQELLQMVPMVLSIMERVLQITAQEAGSAASHQQSKAEIVQTGGASTNRLAFTSSFVDDGIDAWKRQLYYASLSYMDVQFLAQVSAEIPKLEQHLSELGFEIKDHDQKKVLVSGKKQGLRLEGFASTATGPEPQKEKEIAQVIFQTVGVVAGQQDLHQKVGVKNLLRLVEIAARLAGAPRDFKLEMDSEGKTNGELPPEVLKAIQAAQQATLKAVEEKVAQPSAQAAHQAQTEIQQLQAAIKAMEPIFKIAKEQNDATRRKAAEAQTKMQIKSAEFQSAERRKDEEHQAKLKREQEEAAAKIAIGQAKASATAKAETEKAQLEGVLRTVETIHKTKE